MQPDLVVSNCKSYGTSGVSRDDHESRGGVLVDRPTTQSSAALASAAWRKSRRTQANGQCVEVAAVVEAIGIRDSKNPDRFAHLIPRAAFRTLVTRIKHGDLGN